MSGAVNKSETWNVGPATGGGTVDGADPTESANTDAVVSPAGSIDSSAFLPADRATTWNPGMMGVGGIPVHGLRNADPSRRNAR